MKSRSSHRTARAFCDACCCRWRGCSRNVLLPLHTLLSSVTSSFAQFAMKKMHGLLLLSLLPLASPSMLVHTTSGAPLFPSPITSIHAFSSIGCNKFYEIEFSSFDQEAPLVLIVPKDTQSCPDCCNTFSPSSSLPLSSAVVSLVANKTVLMKSQDLEACSPSINFITGYETVHIALVAAGAKAVIMVDHPVVPGWCVLESSGGGGVSFALRYLVQLCEAFSLTNLSVSPLVSSPLLISYHLFSPFLALLSPPKDV